MARGNELRPVSTTSSEAHARLLHDSLEKYNEEQRKRKRPSVILVALIVLFLSSAGGITLAVVLMAKVAEVEAICLSRDFILFAGVMSLLYICLHIFGARRDYKRGDPGPPQMYGQYLHASALLVARLSVVIWIGALVATAILIARAIPLEGFSGKVPFLDLLVCVGAIPSFLIISVTIEKTPAPFATATISSASFLTCRVSQFADDLTADSSVSRRSSLQRRQSETGSALTMPTEAMFRLGASKDEKNASAPKQKKPSASEKTANLPMTETNHSFPRVNLIPSSPVPPIPRRPDPTPTQAVPQPTYCPGGWRAEWNNVAQEAGASQIPENTTDGSSSNSPPSSPYHGPQNKSASSSAGLPSSQTSQTSQLPTAPRTSATANIPTQQHRYSHRMSGSTAPSNLSTVRYASEPEIAVQQSIRVMRNPAYQPRSISAGMNGHKGVEKPVISRPDVALLRNAQRAQKTGAGIQGPRRQPSNFSRPMQKSDSRDETDSKANSGGGVKVPGAFVEDENV